MPSILELAQDSNNKGVTLSGFTGNLILEELLKGEEREFTKNEVNFIIKIVVDSPIIYLAELILPQVKANPNFSFKKFPDFWLKVIYKMQL